VPGGAYDGLHHIDLMVLRPSEDLGLLANEYEPDLPRAFRFLTRGLGTKETRSNDMLSLMMFQQDYLTRLIEMGEADAVKRHSELYRFLSR
jgi:NTE family protein